MDSYLALVGRAGCGDEPGANVTAGSANVLCDVRNIECEK